MGERSVKQRTGGVPSKTDVRSPRNEKQQRAIGWTGYVFVGATAAVAAVAAWVRPSLLTTSGKDDAGPAAVPGTTKSADEEEDRPSLSGSFLEKYLGGEVARQQDKIWSLRQKLEAGDDLTIRKKLAKSLRELHELPAFVGLGPLRASQLRYGTERVLADAVTVTSYQRGMLLHDQMVQILDAPSLGLPSPSVTGSWAAYNPSIAPISWRGRKSFLVTYRLSTWNLCTWPGAGSPLERLPIVDGRKRTTSKVAATIWYEDLQVAVPLHTVEGLEHKKHHCNHHSGMVRMGVDDGRLFSIEGEPWLIVAVVAPKGHTEYCFHNLMLCPLELPETADEKVRCMQKIPVRFKKADKISEQMRAAGILQQVHQKNWVPLVHEGKLYLVFTMEPLLVVQTDLMTGECVEVSRSESPAMRIFHQAAEPGSQHSTLGVHGGSPLIPLPASLGGEQLGIGRIARGNLQYVLFFFTLAATTSSGTREKTSFHIARISRIFCFASTSPHHRGLCETIQFAGGLALLDEGAPATASTLVVTYGTNDCEAKVAMLPLSRVLSMLKPAGRPKVAGSRSQTRKIQ